MEPLACSNQPIDSLAQSDPKPTTWIDHPEWYEVPTKSGFRSLHKNTQMGDGDGLHFWATDATTSEHSDLSPLLAAYQTKDILASRNDLTGPLEFEFNRNGKIEKTGEGKAHEVMGHMKHALRSLLLEHQPIHVQFTGEGKSRKRVYERIAKQLEQETPYVARKADADYQEDPKVVYYLIHKDLINHPAYQENF